MKELICRGTSSMPKPGYYYYDNIRALRTFAFLCIVAAGTYAAKKRSEPAIEVSDIVSRYWVFAVLGVLVVLASLFVIRRFQMRFKEPRPHNYRSRADFVAALERYCERLGYKHGWVYYRSQELWPEP